MSTPRFRLSAGMNFLLISSMYRYMFTVRGHPSTSWNQHGLKMSLQPTHFLHAQWASGVSNVWQAWLVPCVQL